MVDYFSRWIEVARLNNLTSEEAIKHMSSIFARHGIPEVVLSDNDPQYSSDRFSSLLRMMDSNTLQVVRITHKEMGKQREQSRR